MEYAAAISLAWSELSAIAQEKQYTVRFLADEYNIDWQQRSVFSISCNVPARPADTILVLHYLVRKLKGLPQLKGEWISFRQAGGEVYYPNFKTRVLEPIARKYKDKPEGLLELSQRFCAKRVQTADVSVVLEAFEGVPILISFWRGDEEFPAEANVLFDKSIADIFCTEDIVVLTEILAHSI